MAVDCKARCCRRTTHAHRGSCALPPCPAYYPSLACYLGLAPFNLETSKHVQHSYQKTADSNQITSEQCNNTLIIIITTGNLMCCILSSWITMILGYFHILVWVCNWRLSYQQALKLSSIGAILSEIRNVTLCTLMQYHDKCQSKTELCVIHCSFLLSGGAPTSASTSMFIMWKFSVHTYTVWS